MPLMLVRERRNGRVDLLIILQQDSIDRIKQYDPFEVQWPQLPPEYANRLPQTVGVSFATEADAKEIERLTLAGQKDEAFAFATRGFRYQPERGDHDFGPSVIGKPTEGVKQ